MTVGNSVSPPRNDLATHSLERGAAHVVAPAIRAFHYRGHAMMSVMPAPLPPPDDRVPALHALVGADSRELIGAVVAASDGELRSLQTSQVRYVPGRSVTAQYRAEVRWGVGQRSTETFVAASGIDVPEGVPLLESDGMTVAVWQFPNDPFLPGLAAATDPKQAASILEQLGAPRGEARLRTRAYRAGRRAVVEVTTGSARMFVKVLRPERVDALQRRHVNLAGAVAVPHSYGWSRDHGIVALQAMPGRTLRKAIESGTRRLPEPAQLIELLDRFPTPDESSEPVSGPLQRAEDHGHTLVTLIPETRDSIDRLLQSMRNATASKPTGVHGDFHASQVMVRGSDVVGLVDVDTSGSGGRIDDLATLVGHLSTLSLVSPVRGNVERYGRELVAAFDALVDPVELRLRVAAVVLGLATGPFRVQLSTWPQQTQRRIELAEEWVTLP